jgi:2-polyprenyl-3-methyl-5-hydroxy-6-metoxy-1,4-benzoquinol methylase
MCFRTSRFGLARCSSCGCYCIDPPPLQNDDDGPSFYTDYYLEPKKIHMLHDLSNGRTSRFWQVADQVPELEDARDSVIDIGCGEGHLCAELRAAGWRYVSGVDVSRSRIARARQLYPYISFSDEPLGTSGIPEHSIDLAIMDNVVEHLADPVAMLREVATYLKPTSRLVLITPNMDSGHFRFLGRCWTPELAPHVHIFLFTNVALSRLLAMTGFTVQASGSFHAVRYTWSALATRLLAGDIKEALWRSHQELGAIYGRMIGAGPMLYAVARLTGAPGKEIAPRAK